MRAPPVALALVAALVLLPAGLVGCGDDDSGDAESPLGGALRVSADESLAGAFEEIAAAFEDVNPDVDVQLDVDDSATLGTQISDGAAADVFAADGEASIQEVVDSGKIVIVPRVFATAALEIAVPAGNPDEVTGLADLAGDDVTVGLCAEEEACGRAAGEALDQAGVVVTPGDEAAAATLLAGVAGGDLDAAIVYHTDLVAAGDGVEGVEIPEGDNVVARYPIAPTVAASDPEIAQAFVAFVLTSEGQDVLAAHGFLPAP